MSGYFPTVGVVGRGPLVEMLSAPALALGIDIIHIDLENDSAILANCSVATFVGDPIALARVRTLENIGASFRPNSSAMGLINEWNVGTAPDFETKFSVLVARSPHGQASAWTPTEINDDKTGLGTVTPALHLSPGQMAMAQSLALDLTLKFGTVGVMDVEIFLQDGKLKAGHLTLGPTANGMWTIEGSRTSQFEQHLRAILDLPLGDPSMLATFAVSGAFFGDGNMYRPYLHLMARSPRLKFHQSRSEGSNSQGHVTAMGEDLLDLIECVTHAVEYMSGVIDE